MTVFFPDADRAALAAVLAARPTLLVACLCAEWCTTCKEYQPRFQDLAAQQTDQVFVWVDIEEHPELLDDADIEDFPTLLIQDEHRTLFYGPILPHIGHLERLLGALLSDPAGASPLAGAPQLRRYLSSPAVA